MRDLNQVLAALQLSNKPWCCDRCRAAALKIDFVIPAEAKEPKRAKPAPR
jgi:hypothetical protein